MSQQWWKLSGKKPRVTTLLDDTQLEWSEDPSCFERHLQRRHNNPLFRPERRQVTQADINNARNKDIEDAANLRTEMVTALSDFTDPHAKGLAIDNMPEISSMLDHYLQRAAGIGGYYGTELTERLRRIWDAVHKDIEVAMNGNPEAVLALHHAKRSQETLGLFLRKPFSAQMTRTDTPIHVDEIIPSLILEDIHAFKFSFEILEQQDRKEIAVAALKSLKDAADNNVSVSDYPAKVNFVLNLL